MGVCVRMCPSPPVSLSCPLSLAPSLSSFSPSLPPSLSLALPPSQCTPSSKRVCKHKKAESTKQYANSALMCTSAGESEAAPFGSPQRIAWYHPLSVPRIPLSQCLSQYWASCIGRERNTTTWQNQIRKRTIAGQIVPGLRFF
eukprot:3934461-Rhodomonas_salina.3